MPKIITIGSQLVTMGSKLLIKEFTPKDVPGLKLWVNGDNVIKDGSNYVSQLTDLSNNSFHLVQTTQINKPLWVDNQFNGYPIIKFDGINDFLQVIFGETFYQPQTFFIVMNSLQPAPSYGAVYQGSQSPFKTFLIVGPGTIMYNDGTVGFTYIKVSPWNSLLLNTLHNGVNSAIYENGILKNSGSAGAATSITQLRIGLRWDNSSPLNAEIAEIIFYNAALNLANRQNVENYLMSKYNLT